MTNTDATAGLSTEGNTSTVTEKTTGSHGSSYGASSSYSNSQNEPAVMSLETLTALTRLYGCMSIVCFLFGLALNALVFSYFYSRRKTLSNTLYCVIVIVDMLVCTLMLPYTLPHFSESRAPLLFSSQGFCKFWTAVWGAASKMTVVLVAVMGIVRTVLLITPLNTSIRSLKKRVVVGVLSLYFTVLLLCETVPMWQDYHWYFDRQRMRCEWHDTAELDCNDKCNRVRTFGYVWNSVTLAVPVLPMLVSAMLSVYGLNRGERGGDKGKRYASTTIVLFTLLYVVLNIPTLIYWIMMLAHWSSGYTTNLLKFDQPYYFYSNFVEILSVAINSFLNPVLYLIRMRELRKYFSPQIEKFRAGGSFYHRQSTRSQLTSQSTNLSTASNWRKWSAASRKRSVAQVNGDKDIPMANMENK